jgi:hypothetical protein
MMAKMRPMSVLLILLSSGISILSGVLLDHSSPGTTANYRAIYYGARCLIKHSDPYNPEDFLRVYSAESGEFPSAPVRRQFFLRAVPVCVNLPTTLFLVAPLALLTWGPSHVIWLILIGCSITAAALLAYDLAREYAPGVALLLICIMLANCEVLFAVGNTAGLAVGLCVVAVWCFVRERLVWAGVLCLAVSLALKPHDSGLVWLYLLLAGGALRKRGLQALALTVLFAIPTVMWVSGVAPHWNHELRANLAAISSHGDISDPGPTSISRKGSTDVIIDLQSVVSAFKDDPSFYNPVVFTICGILLVVWGVTTLRAQGSTANTWYALASISALSMLGSYHRPYDAKLLLLAVPGCACLWARGGLIGKVGVYLVGAGTIVTADIPLAVLSLLTRRLDVATMPLGEKLLTIFFTRPAPLVLLLVSVFYLAVYVCGKQHDAQIHVQLKAEAACQ